MKLGIIVKHIGSSCSERDGEIEITGISSLELADEKSITFIYKDKFIDHARCSKAAAIIVKKGMVVAGKVNCVVDDPYLAYAQVGQLFEDRSPLFEGPIHPTAVISATAKLHPTVSVGPLSVIGPECIIAEKTVIGAHCVIEKGTQVGSDCHIDSGAIIRRGCRIGNRVIIQSGSVIGSEGFGNALNRGEFVRIPCFGTVMLEDDVEIGANVTIDRGNFSPTIVKKGSRVDNLVQIAHNVEIGRHSALCAQVGISGSTKIGNHCMVGGQAGFVGHIEIGDGAFIGAQAGVNNSVEPGKKVTGYPARDLIKMRRIEAVMQNLPQMHKELKELRAAVAELKSKLQA
ncbi:MAG: UDP-3-O-(3-hydroxymyristoyl)glucosamine N-acyltransferase [Chitinivibrionales bacterium]|nr:UDP-3-O-(3-hydroxymyristoyl)glucosamine N-acyltransferase [Chitinivibrionales bacterium]